jgi:hypothetical protein
MRKILARSGSLVGLRYRAGFATPAQRISIFKRQSAPLWMFGSWEAFRQVFPDRYTCAS